MIIFELIFALSWLLVFDSVQVQTHFEYRIKSAIVSKRIQNPTESLRWSCLQSKLLTALRIQFCLNLGLYLNFV